MALLGWFRGVSWGFMLGWFHGAGAAGAALAGWGGRSPSPLVLGGKPELPLPFCTKGGGRAIPCSHTLSLLEPRDPGHVPAAPTPGPEGAKRVRCRGCTAGPGRPLPAGIPGALCPPAPPAARAEPPSCPRPGPSRLPGCSGDTAGLPQPRAPAAAPGAGGDPLPGLAATSSGRSGPGRGSRRGPARGGAGTGWAAPFPRGGGCSGAAAERFAPWVENVRHDFQNQLEPRSRSSPRGSRGTGSPCVRPGCPDRGTSGAPGTGSAPPTSGPAPAVPRLAERGGAGPGSGDGGGTGDVAVAAAAAGGTAGGRGGRAAGGGGAGAGAALAGPPGRRRGALGGAGAGGGRARHLPAALAARCRRGRGRDGLQRGGGGRRAVPLPARLLRLPPLLVRGAAPPARPAAAAADRDPRHRPRQVPLLPERLHPELLLRLVGLGALGAGDRLDGAEWYQPGTGFRGAGGGLAAGVPDPGAEPVGDRHVLHGAGVPGLEPHGEPARLGRAAAASLAPQTALPAVPDRGEDALAGDDHGAAGLRGPRAPGGSSGLPTCERHSPRGLEPFRLHLLVYVPAGPGGPHVPGDRDPLPEGADQGVWHRPRLQRRHLQRDDSPLLRPCLSLQGQQRCFQVHDGSRPRGAVADAGLALPAPAGFLAAGAGASAAARRPPRQDDRSRPLCRVQARLPVDRVLLRAALHLVHAAQLWGQPRPLWHRGGHQPRPLRCSPLPQLHHGWHRAGARGHRAERHGVRADERAGLAPGAPRPPQLGDPLRRAPLRCPERRGGRLLAAAPPQRLQLHRGLRQPQPQPAGAPALAAHGHGAVVQRQRRLRGLAAAAERRRGAGRQHHLPLRPGGRHPAGGPAAGERLLREHPPGFPEPRAAGAADGRRRVGVRPAAGAGQPPVQPQPLLAGPLAGKRPRRGHQRPGGRAVRAERPEPGDALGTQREHPGLCQQAAGGAGAGLLWRALEPVCLRVGGEPQLGQPVPPGPVQPGCLPGGERLCLQQEALPGRAGWGHAGHLQEAVPQIPPQRPAARPGRAGVTWAAPPQGGRAGTVCLPCPGSRGSCNEGAEPRWPPAKLDVRRGAGSWMGGRLCPKDSSCAVLSPARLAGA